MAAKIINIKNKGMLMIVTILLLISNICYPFSELFKYYAFGNLIKDNYVTK